MVRRLLVRKGESKQLRFRERPAEEFQAHRQRIAGETHRHRQRRESGLRTDAAIVAASVAVGGARVGQHVGRNHGRCGIVRGVHHRVELTVGHQRQQRHAQGFALLQHLQVARVVGRLAEIFDHRARPPGIDRAGEHDLSQGLHRCVGVLHEVGVGGLLGLEVVAHTAAAAGNRQ